MNWYFMQGGERKGPVNLDGLRELLQDGEIDKQTMVWNKGMGDQWAKIADVPALAGPSENADDPEVKEDFRRKLEERKAKMAAEQSAGLKRNVIIGVSAAVLIAATVVLMKGAPKRAWGISAAEPVCSLEKLEKKLIDEYQMEKTAVEKFLHFGRTSAKTYQYADAKSTPGGHVSAKGTIAVTVDDDQNVKAVAATFPSPGMRGPLLNNRSVGSLTMDELWAAHGGEEKKLLGVKAQELPGPEQSGLANIPPDAVCQVIETEKMRAIWTEHGPNTRHSIVYFEAR